MGAWPAELFTEIGLFDEELVRNQDDEFNYRLRKHGGKILLNPEIKSYYTVRSKPGTFGVNTFSTGSGRSEFAKHPRQMSLRHFIPAIFMLGLVACVFVCLLIPPFLRIWGFGFILFFILLPLFYQL